VVDQIDELAKKVTLLAKLLRTLVHEEVDYHTIVRAADMLREHLEAQSAKKT
jgi:hypothetical protein